jgi:hypothetical protein
MQHVSSQWYMCLTNFQPPDGLHPFSQETYRQSRIGKKKEWSIYTYQDEGDKCHGGICGHIISKYIP